MTRRYLRDHVVELQETDNLQGLSIAAVELVNMLVAVDRLEDAARLLDYLENTDLLTGDGFRSLTEDAARTVAAAGLGRPGGVAFPDDDSAALTHMRTVLEDLVRTAATLPA